MLHARAVELLSYGFEAAGAAEPGLPLLPLALQRLGDLKRQFEGLAGVEPRIAMRVIAVGERGFADRLRAADAFGDVLPRQLEMHAAGIAALGQMHREGAMNLVEDAVEAAGLVAGRGRDRVAVHRID